MTEAPGVPRLVLRYWAAIGFFVLPISIAHTLFLSPTLAGTARFTPDAGTYVLLATVAWIAIYTALTIQLFRVSDVESLREFFEDLTIDQQRVLVVFVVVFVNSVVVFAGIAGVAVASVTSPVVGVAAAVTYPFLELRFSLTRPTPAKAVVGATIALAHALGAARTVTVEGFVESLPGWQQGGPGATRAA